MNQKSLTLDSPLLFIYFNFFYIAQIVVLDLGTRCPPRDPSLLVSCSPAPHHVFPEGPLDGHGRNAVFDENALSLFCMKDSKEEKPAQNFGNLIKTRNFAEVKLHSTI